MYCTLDKITTVNDLYWECNEAQNLVFGLEQNEWNVQNSIGFDRDLDSTMKDGKARLEYLAEPHQLT